MIAITPKINPDLDGYSCAFGFSELLNKTGKKAVGVASGNLQREIEFLSQEFNIQKLPSDEKIILKADQIILVDASDLKGMPKETDPRKVIEVIDHRISPKVKETFPNAKIQIEKVGAAATLIAERFKEKNISLSRESAILIYGAIASNTLNFQASVTSQKDKIIFDWLAKKADPPLDLIPRMFEYKSQFDDNSFEKAVISDFQEIEAGDKSIGIAQLEVVGLRKILDKRGDQLFRILEKLKTEKNLDFVFLTAVDLSKGINLFATNHKPTKKLLEKSLDINFNNTSFAEKSGVTLRKEIIPILRDYLK